MRQRPMTYAEFMQASTGMTPMQRAYLQQMQTAQQYPQSAPQRGGNSSAGSSVLSTLPEAYKAYQSFGGGAAATPAATTAASSATAPSVAAYGLSPETMSAQSALEAYQAGPTVQNAAGVQGGAASGTPLFDVGAPSYAGYLAAAYDAYKGYENLTGNDLRDEQKATKAQQDIGLAVADVYTGGLAGMAERALRGNKTTRKWLEKGDELDRKFNPVTRMINRYATDEWKTEGNKLKELQKKGVVIPESLQGPMNLKRGRTSGQLVKEEQAKIDAGKYGNTEFAKSRDEKSLKPEDIWGYSAFFDKYGNDWLQKMNEGQRRSIAQRALDSGAVNEGKGTINVDWNKFNTDDIYKAPPSSSPVPKPVTGQTIQKPVGNAGAKGQEIMNKVSPQAKTMIASMGGDPNQIRNASYISVPKRGTPIKSPINMSEAQRRQLNLR